jgi:Phasin protein
MQEQLNQFAALNNIGWDTNLDVASALADSAGQMGRLQLEAAKAMRAAIGHSARSLSGLGSFAESMPTTATTVANGFETAANYSREAHDIVSGTRVRLLELMQAGSSQLGQGWVATLERMWTAGAAAGINADGWSKAADVLINGFTQAAMQSVQLAEAAIKAAASATARVKEVSAAS